MIEDGPAAGRRVEIPSRGRRQQSDGLRRSERFGRARRYAGGDRLYRPEPASRPTVESVFCTGLGADAEAADAEPPRARAPSAARDAPSRPFRDDDDAPDDDGFARAASYRGSRPGYAFKLGTRGLGYYRDDEPTRAAAAAAVSFRADPRAAATVSWERRAERTTAVSRHSAERAPSGLADAPGAYAEPSTAAYAVRAEIFVTLFKSIDACGPNAANTIERGHPSRSSRAGTRPPKRSPPARTTTRPRSLHHTSRRCGRR